MQSCFVIFLALLWTLSSSSLDCPHTKRCADPPVSPTDILGMNSCFGQPLAIDCLTTTTEPFFTCRCSCDRCSTPPQSCEATCISSSTTTTPLPRGPQLFTIGGFNGRPYYAKDVDIYDFETSLWTKAADLPAPTDSLGAGTALNGMAYAVGGRSPGATVQTFAYDAKLDKWSPAPSMTTARYGHGVAEFEGKIYAVGGQDGSRYLRSAESFHQQANKWDKIADMNVQRGYTAVAVLGDNLYAIGGVVNSVLNSVEVYNPKTGNWSAVAPMNTAREQHCAASVGDTIYAIGGYNSGYLKSVEAYNSKSDKWNFVAEMTTPRQGCGAVSLNGLLYVVGGYNRDSGFLDTMEEYNAKTNTWRLLPARMPTPRQFLGAALLVE